IFSMTRDTSDGRFRLTEFIKVNIQPRSVFVNMTVKNLDSVRHPVLMLREVGPAIDGSPTNDQYTEYGRTGGSVGATGHVWDSAAVGSNSLLFGPTQSPAQVRTATVAAFQAAGGCGPDEPFLDAPGYYVGG